MIDLQKIQAFTCHVSDRRAHAGEWPSRPWKACLVPIPRIRPSAKPSYHIYHPLPVWHTSLCKCSIRTRSICKFCTNHLLHTRCIVVERAGLPRRAQFVVEMLGRLGAHCLRNNNCADCADSKGLVLPASSNLIDHGRFGPDPNGPQKREPCCSIRLINWAR